MPENDTESTRTFIGGLVALVVAGGLTMMLAQTGLTPVNDELANLPAGVALVATGQQSDPTHPPLARYWMGLPLLVMGVSAMPDHPALGADWHPYGRDFLFRNNADWRSILFAGRAMGILASMGLVVLVAAWVRRRYGTFAGLASATFLAFEPTLLGHGALTTLDLALTLAFVGVTLLHLRYREAPSTGRAFALILGLAAAVMVKFAALLLIPGLLAIEAVLVFRRKRGVPVPPGVRLRVLVAALVVAVVASWAAYGFEVRSLAQDPQITAVREAERIQAGIAKVADRMGIQADTLMNAPIPGYSLIKGLGLQVFHAANQDAWEDADFYQYLNGAYNRNGFRDYYLWTFLFKSTLPSLVLMAGLAAAWLTLRRRRAPSDSRTASPAGPVGSLWPWIVLPAGIYFLACSAQTINIGHRYVLPVIPFLAIGVGIGAGRLWRQLVTARAQGRPVWKAAIPAGVATALLTAHVLASLSAFPHYIAYFNRLAGGIDGGIAHLSDSNLDWGQDLGFLDTDARAHCRDGRHCVAAVFGTARPEDFGTPVVPWAKGMDPFAHDGPATFYVSANRWLLRSRAHPDGLFPFLAGRTPDRRVGASILVFESGGRTPTVEGVLE